MLFNLKGQESCHCCCVEEETLQKERREIQEEIRMQLWRLMYWHVISFSIHSTHPHFAQESVTFPLCETSHWFLYLDNKTSTSIRVPSVHLSGRKTKGHLTFPSYKKSLTKNFEGDDGPIRAVAPDMMGVIYTRGRQPFESEK